MLRSVFLALTLGIPLFAHLSSARAAKALVPAYVPFENADSWQPLYEQIDTHANTTFIVIINPASGPGTSPPDANYQREISGLHQRPNVKTVGYVALTHADKPADSASKEIDVYASWRSSPAANTAVYVDGIFFDETPSAAADLAYVQSLIAYARTKIPDAYVVINPGVPPESKAYLNASPAPDLALVFENTYEAWNNDVAANRQQIWDLDADDEQLAVMLHDMPDLSCAELTALADDLKGEVGAGALWFTDRVGDASYTGWPSSEQFGKYVSALPDGGEAC